MSLHAFTISASFVFAQGEIAMQRGVTKAIINGVFTRGEIATRRGVTKSTCDKDNLLPVGNQLFIVSHECSTFSCCKFMKSHVTHGNG